MVKNLPANIGDMGSIPGWGRSLEKEMATHSSILAWEVPWTEEPGGLQFMGSQRLRYDLATKQNNKSKHSFNHMNFRIICITLVKNIYW